MIDTKQADNSSDEELLKLSLENQDNFWYLVNRYQKKLFNYIQRLTNISQEDIEDLLQEIFIKVYLNLNNFDSSLKFSSWIYRITHNQVISNHRHLKARPEGYISIMDENKFNNFLADVNIVQEIDLKIMRKNIFKILNKLKTKYREVLILKFLEEKSYQEISDIIKKPSGTVASLINRAKQEFRKEVAQEKNIL